MLKITTYSHTHIFDFVSFHFVSWSNNNYFYISFDFIWFYWFTSNQLFLSYFMLIYFIEILCCNTYNSIIQIVLIISIFIKSIFIFIIFNWENGKNKNVFLPKEKIRIWKIWRKWDEEMKDVKKKKWKIWDEEYEEMKMIGIWKNRDCLYLNEHVYDYE